MELSLHLARNPHLRNHYGERFRKQRDAMARIAEQGAADFGFTLPLPAQEFITGLFALGDGIVLTHLVNPEDTPPDLFGKMLGLIFSGVEPSADGTSEGAKRARKVAAKR